MTPLSHRWFSGCSHYAHATNGCTYTPTVGRIRFCLQHVLPVVTICCDSGLRCRLRVPSARYPRTPRTHRCLRRTLGLPARRWLLTRHTVGFRAYCLLTRLHALVLVWLRSWRPPDCVAYACRCYALRTLHAFTWLAFSVYANAFGHTLGCYAHLPCRYVLCCTYGLPGWFAIHSLLRRDTSPYAVAERYPQFTFRDVPVLPLPTFVGCVLHRVTEHAAHTRTVFFLVRAVVCQHRRDSIVVGCCPCPHAATHHCTAHVTHARAFTLPAPLDVALASATPVHRACRRVPDYRYLTATLNTGWTFTTCR